VTLLARCIPCSPQMARASLTRFPESGQLFRHRVNPPQSPGQPEAGSGMYVEDVHGRRYVDFRGNTVQQVWGFATAGLLVHKGPVGDSSILYLPVHQIPAIKLAKKLGGVGAR